MFSGNFLNMKFGHFLQNSQKIKAKLRRRKLSCLERKLKELEQNLSNDEAKEQYNAYRGEINEIYDDMSNGIKIRSKCDWYEFGEKSNEFSLTLKKRRAKQNIVRKVLSYEQEITDLSKVKPHIYQFYQHLYNKKQNTSEHSICDFLNDLAVHSLTTEQLLS